MYLSSFPHRNREAIKYVIKIFNQAAINKDAGERTGLVVRASDSGSGDPGSIFDRVGVLFP